MEIKNRFYLLYLKPVFDFFVASVLLIFLLPFLLLLVIVLLVLNRGEVFFVQKRPGKNTIPIYILKFKTMNDSKDTDGNLLSAHQRITPWGQLLRKFSIDELPQLVNVIQGDMSLVGPRPLLFDYVPFYNEDQQKRHLVKPGITGWAQVNGRNAISWNEKFLLDREYVENVTFLFDIKILFLTIIKVIGRQGIYDKGNIPPAPFKGNGDRNML